MKRDQKVVVIGGGLGGLSAAASLAAEGFEVELLEKNAHLGGKLNVAEQDGFRFDLGPSIFILPQIFEPIWERAGKRMSDYVRLKEVLPQWRCFYEDGTVLDLHPDVRVMERELAKLGDTAADGYYAFLDYSRRLYKFSEATIFDRGDDTTLEILAGHDKLRALRLLDIPRSVSDGVRRFVDEPHLQQMLDFFIKYVGSSSYDAPAVLNLMLFSQLGYGLWYVEGGMYNLARGLERLLGDLGVTVRKNAEVVRINKAGEYVDGVVLADGQVVRADLVVSNMEVIPAYERLLEEDHKFLKKLEKWAPACSGLVLHLGVDTVYPQLRHHCFFFSGNQKKHFRSVFHEGKLPGDPTIYLVAPCVTDPDLAPEGHSIIKALPHIPPVQDEPFTERQYLDLKERVLAKLERMGLCDLRRHVVTEHMLVPEDIERMYYSNRGAIYGVVADRVKNWGLKAPKRSEKYRNLYFAGGSVNPGGGMCMVTLSGRQVRDKVLQDLASGRLSQPRG